LGHIKPFEWTQPADATKLVLGFWSNLNAYRISLTGQFRWERVPKSVFLVDVHCVTGEQERYGYAA